MGGSRPWPQIGIRRARRHGDGLGRALFRLIDKPLQPVDTEGAVPQHVGERASLHVLDHHAEKQVVGLCVGEGASGRSLPGRQQLQYLGRRPDPLKVGLVTTVQQVVVVRNAAAVAEKVADGRPVRVELEIPRKVIGDQVVETQFSGLGHQHHLGCYHRLGDARNGELVINL